MKTANSNFVWGFCFFAAKHVSEWASLEITWQVNLAKRQNQLVNFALFLRGVKVATQQKQSWRICQSSYPTETIFLPKEGSG